MPLFDDIYVEIQQELIPEHFTYSDLKHAPYNNRYLINNNSYSAATLRTAPANNCNNPPGNAVANGSPARVRRVAVGQYQLLDNPVEHIPIVTDENKEPTQNSTTRDDIETRDKFIEQTSSFIDWLTSSLNEFDGFQHTWRANGGRHQTGFPQNTLWSCTSLFSAYQQYAWPSRVTSKSHPEYNWHGAGFAETTDFLIKLESDLKSAIKDSNPRLARVVCRKILEWGGVIHRPNIAKTLMREMNENQAANHLDDTSTHLNKLISDGFSEADLEYTDRNGNCLRLDSGTTKIYAMLCDSFIIYDGRVASALGLLVLRWWNNPTNEERQSHQNQLPKVLRFSHCGNNVGRKPPALPGAELLKPMSIGRLRTAENIRATWLLSEALERDKRLNALGSNFSLIKDRNLALRALEAALFMVGYSID